MAKAIFYHREGSGYKDDPARCYHFPKRYLSRVKQTLNDLIVYYGPRPEKSGPYYFAFARVQRIEPDFQLSDHFFAYVDAFLDFDADVDYKENGGYEKALFKPDGSVNSGRAVQAVRIIDSSEFAAIVARGFSKNQEWPGRTDEEAAIDPSGFSELDQAAFEHDPNIEFDRRIVQQLLNRPYRDAKFKQHVREVYDRTCAFTGLRLINGRGRPEVEAAHIQPVEAGGPDTIRNGIALSGTVHWMFDRGLLSLADDFTILHSRQLNHDVSRLLAGDGRAIVPSPAHLRPHPHYLEWHRDTCFKA